MLKRLVVPHSKQIRDGFCLPACVEMVLDLPQNWIRQFIWII
jgi:hypothetical protein